MTTINLTLGERIALARRRAGKDGRAVAAALGVTQAAVSLWERDKAKPSIDRVERLAAVLGVDLLWLAWGLDQDPLESRRVSNSQRLNTRSSTIEYSAESLFPGWLGDRGRDCDDWQLCSSAPGSRSGGPCDARQVSQILAHTLARAGVSATGHKLRASFATRLWEASGDIRLTADVLGHADLQTVQRYVAVETRRAAAAVALME